MTDKTRGRLRVLALVAAALLPEAGIAAAAGSTSTNVMSAPGEQTMELEEVEVIGKKLYQMQRELVQAQDRFYTLYNELNPNDDFDIHCTMEARTGAIIKKRECRLEFLMEASAQDGRDFYLSITGSAMGSAGATPEALWLLRQDEFRKTIRSVIEAHPELMQRAGEWQQQQARFEKARKERLKGRFILIE